MGIRDKLNSLDKLREDIRQRRKDRERLQSKKELEEYNKRQERYNDMLKDEALKQKFLTNMDKIKINTYTKRMVAIIIGFAIVCISTSYILAFLNKDNTLESLSNQLCITILGVAFVYMIRAYFDSRAEHKNLDNQIKSEIIDTLTERVSEVFSQAGLNIDASEFINSSIKDTQIEEEEEDEEPLSGLRIRKPNKPQHRINIPTDDDGSVG